MNIFEIILAPFIFIIKHFFLFGYQLTGSYGWAIIVLSFLISLLLLPVFIYIEKQKKKTDAVKRKMQPVEDEIKRCYKGQERYYYIRTLHRQHGYSPFKAMIPILSLLLQIPFFIAAYQFLEHYQPLQGVSFGFIKDLSKPDGLLGVINILPVLMTVVNLITAWLYTRNGNTSERKQMLVIALIFLILLFDLPSGLVLYWTMNNVFSFLRLFITNPEVFKNISLRQISTNLKSAVIKNRAGILLSVLVFIIYFYLAGIFYYTGVNRGILNISAFVLLLAELFSLIFIKKNGKKVFTESFGLYYLFLLVVFSLQILVFILLEKKVEINISGINMSSYQSSLFLGIVVLLSTLPFYFKFWNLKLANVTKGFNAVYILALFYITGLIFFWNPLIVFSSFPQNFNFAGISFFYFNIKPFLIVFIAGLLIYFVTPRKYRSLPLIFILFATFTVFVYSALIPFDVGTLQGNFFSKEDNLKIDISALFLDISLLLTILLTVVWLVKKEKRKLLLITLILLNISIVTQSLYDAFKSKSFFTNKETQAKNKNKEMAKIHFSKTKPNILIFFPDGAQGWYMHDMIKEQPGTKEKYDGFVWYPNCVSTSNYTYASTPAMLCGKGYTIEELNKDKSHTIREKYTKSVKCFVKNIDSAGYFLTTTRFKYSNLTPDAYDNYIPIWDDKWSDLLGLSGHSEAWYTRLWENALFNGSPLFLKPKVYNNRKWVIQSNVDMNSSDVYKYNFLRVLPKISDTISSDSNFIFLHSMSTHAPWDIITKDGKFIRDVSPYENHKWVMNEFAKYIKWMKKNGVYDNTKIIVVSDHGPSWWHYKKKYKVDVPVKNFDYNKISMLEFLRLNSLLMVKDFNRRGTIKEDWRLVTNADLMNIAMDKNDPTKSDSTSRTVKSFYTQWHKDLDSRTTYKLNSAYKVKDYVYDIDNWTLIDGKRLKNYNPAKKITEKDHIIETIKNDSAWFNSIKKKAAKNNISVEKQLEKDAEWILKNNKK